MTRMRATDMWYTVSGLPARERRRQSCGLRSWALLGLVLVLPCLTLAQETPSVASFMSRLATELAQRFPEVTGEVLKVEGEHAYVSLGRQNNISAGMRLTLYREDAAINESRRLEETLGTVDVTQVFERYAIGTIASQSQAGAVRNGDKVRITAGRLAVGLLPMVTQTPFPGSLEALETQLQQALDITGRFRPVSPDRIRVWLVEHGHPLTEALPADAYPSLAQTIQVSYLLIPQIKDIRGTSILELVMVSPVQRIPVATASGLLPPAALIRPAPPQPAAPVPPTAAVPQPQRGDWFKTPMHAPGTIPAEWNLANNLIALHRVNDALVGLDAGDMDGDGTTEVVIATETQVQLYRLTGEQLTLLDTFALRSEGKLLSLQLLRLGAGEPMGVLVNQQVPSDGMDSFILTVQDQRLIVWQDKLFDILLAIDSDGDGVKETVWGQPFDDEQFFRRGMVRRYQPVKGTLHQKGKRTVPHAFRTTGATLATLSVDGPRRLVFVDEERRVRVYQGKKKLWDSPSGIGGSNTFGELDLQSGVDVLKQLFFFEPNPVAVDLNGDGIEEVLIARNAASLGRLLVNRTDYRDGDIVLLREETYGYSLTPISPQFNGMISGLVVLRDATPGVLVAATRTHDALGRKAETTLFLSRLR